MSEIVTIHEDIYPGLLKDIQDPPDMLYYRGDIGVINENPCIAIIGARDPSEEGLSTAYYMGRIAALNGFVVVNGLASGCDTAALQGALSVNGKCAVTLPCGLSRIYPESNFGLSENIIEHGGCIISEYRDDAGVEKWRFVERDRLQSGMSKGTLAVETKIDGGTMHTARFAVRDLRLLATYKSSALKNDDGNKLLHEKYHAILIETERDFDGFLTDLRSYTPAVARQLELDFGDEK